MKLKRYESYDLYVKSQEDTDRKKGPRPALHYIEVSDNASWLRRRGHVSYGMCHGARAGQEVDWFRDEFPGAKIWGTDLFPKGHLSVCKWDFSRPRRKWVGKFDFVYSNALDHAMDPVATLKCWFNQLKPDGFLLIQWSRYHIRSLCGDCFGAHFHEYIAMLNSIGKVVDVNFHYKTTVTIISRRR